MIAAATDRLPIVGTILIAGQGRGAAGLAAALAERGFRSVVVDRFAEARTEARRISPDAVLIGTDPAAGDRRRFTRELAGDAAAGLALYLLARADVEEAREALALGADDVVVPPHSAGAILVRLGVFQSRMAAGRVPGRTVAWGRLTLDLTSRRVLDGTQPLTLSGREFELLLHLLEAGGRVVGRDELLAAIWGGGQESGAVLDATVHRLRRKLEEVVPEPDLVETVRGVGYRLDLPRGDGGAAAD